MLPCSAGTAALHGVVLCVSARGSVFLAQITAVLWFGGLRVHSSVCMSTAAAWCTCSWCSWVTALRTIKCSVALYFSLVFVVVVSWSLPLMPNLSVTGVQDGWAVLPALGWLLVPRVFPCYLQGFRLLPSMLGSQVPINTTCQERALPHRTLSLCFSCANAEQQQDAQPLTQDSPWLHLWQKLSQRSCQDFKASWDTGARFCLALECSPWLYCFFAALQWSVLEKA